MGILNLTPDSFSDGGTLRELDAVVRRAEEMVAQGAALLDIGGESTRPGAVPVEEEEEVRRILPAIRALARRVPVPISVDTRKSAVARVALDEGVSIINDVSALSFDPRMARVVASSGAGVVLMHSRGTPAEMHQLDRYTEGVEVEVARELKASIGLAVREGIERESIVLDPGIGFAKTAAQSTRLIARLDSLQEFGLPLLVGPSRKSFLGELLGLPPQDRVLASAVACAMAYLRGARIFRVHDVAETSQALRLAHALEAERGDVVATPARGTQ
jgi:dihydropteroate synthase